MVLLHYFVKIKESHIILSRMFDPPKLHYKYWSIMDKKETTVHLKVVKMVNFILCIFDYNFNKWQAYFSL